MKHETLLLTKTNLEKRLRWWALLTRRLPPKKRHNIRLQPTSLMCVHVCALILEQPAVFFGTFHRGKRAERSCVTPVRSGAALLGGCGFSSISVLLPSHAAGISSSQGQASHTVERRSCQQQIPEQSHTFIYRSMQTDLSHQTLFSRPILLGDCF